MTTQRQPLSDEQLHRFAPSIFAREAHESRSERYGYAPTFEILAALRTEGFLPVHASQSSTRDASRREHTKHMIRFTHRSQLEQLAAGRAVGDVFPEVVLINAHDGSSAYQLMGGLFRLVCLNGLVVADAMVGTFKVQHTGKIRERVIEGSYTVLQNTTRAVEVADEWKGIALEIDERDALAEAAHQVRFADAEGNVSTPITPAQLLIPRRYADDRKDLWTTFNVLQENAIRGGLQGRTQPGPNASRGRRVTTREIRGIDQDIRLNRALWALGARMADIKLGRHVEEPQPEPEVIDAERIREFEDAV